VRKRIFFRGQKIASFIAWIVLTIVTVTAQAGLTVIGKFPAIAGAPPQPWRIVQFDTAIAPNFEDTGY
jgi:hypothetical protein